jgi:chromosome segregation ATPase
MNQLRTFGAQIFQHAAEARRAFDVERNRNLAALRTERDDLSNTLARIKEEKLNTESRLRTLLGEVNTLRRNDETLRAECAALRRLLQGGSEQERQRLENENRALRAKCADLQRLQGGSEQERQRLENENRALRAECAGFRARLAQFEQKEE